MNGLEIKILEKRPCEIELEFEINQEAVDAARLKAFTKIQAQAEIKGFRKGKAPLDMIKMKFSANAEHELLQELIPQAISEGVKSQKIDALFYPEVKDMDVKDGIVKFKAVYEVAPNFEVNNYKGLAIKKKVAKVTEKDLKDYLNQLRDRSSSLEVDEAAIISDDSFVTIDYEGKIDGEVFEGGSEKDRILSIKNSGFIDGFSEGLVGLKVADEKKLELKFPKDYHAKEYADKDVVFYVKVLEIKKKVLPKLDTEFVKKFGADSVEDLKKKTKESLNLEKEKQNKRELEDEVIDKLIKNNPVEVPKTMVVNETNRIAEKTKEQYKYYGMNDFDVTPMMDKFKKDAERQVKAYYILNQITDKESLKADDQDIESRIQEALKQNPTQEKEVKAYFEDSKNKVNIMTDIVHKKLFDFLLENAKK
ncbi:MAG: trigger factor [bacterium]|nr:trigger factor [bacterium]